MKLIDRILEMDEEELRSFLIDECGADDTIVPLDEMDKNALIDYIADNYHPEIIELHSECQGGDYNSMHPDETEEEFHDHED